MASIEDLKSILQSWIPNLLGVIQVKHQATSTQLSLVYVKN